LTVSLTATLTATATATSNRTCAGIRDDLVAVAVRVAVNVHAIRGRERPYSRTSM
jgi:hypothetical protein